MSWLTRHSWWGLLFFSLVLVLFGVGDIIQGVGADRLIPLGLTGRTPDELAAESPDAFALYDFSTRSNGLTLMAMGVLLALTVLIPFRQNQTWAWWAMWVLPVWSFAVMTQFLIQGVQPDQPPPPPMVSGPVVGTLSILILLLSAPRFFPRRAVGVGRAGA